MSDSPKGAHFTTIHGGAIQDDGSTEATFIWPKGEHLTLGTPVCIVSKDALCNLVDNANDLIRRADSTIITDAVRNKFQKVFVDDVQALAAALKRLSSGDREPAP